VTRIEHRLAALESRLHRNGGSDPMALYHAMLELGHDAPMPQAGQPVQDWLRTVPTPALEALLEAYE
jgi:hypothetical protein